MARLPRRLAVLAIVATAVAAALQPSAHASAAASWAAGRTAVGARSVASANQQLDRHAAQPMINVVTGRAMSATEAAVADLADSQASAAISRITAPTLATDSLSVIPADFSRVMGYTPAIGRLANGAAVAINPEGGCSVIGGGRPFDLDIPCKAHDLGYDLLRYAHRHGQDLGPRARQLVDAKFGRDLAAQCRGRYRGSQVRACDVMAASFDAGVGFNSWRQGFGAPIAAAGLVRTVGIVALALLAIFFALRALAIVIFRRVRGRRKLRLTPAQTLTTPRPAPTVTAT